ncbi:MAG: hypothetical protein JWM41_1964 [Gemmatimonadetes bacterium]|nr:hypothetical protein [Gemmatimonadota bacterium]
MPPGLASMPSLGVLTQGKKLDDYVFLGPARIASICGRRCPDSLFL